MKIRITVPHDATTHARLIIRDNSTGRDSQPSEIEPGQFVDANVTSTSHLVVLPGAPYTK